MTKLYKAGIGWGDLVQDILRRLLDAVFETLWNLANSIIIVLNIDDGRCPGVIISLLWRPVSTDCTFFGAQ